MDKRRFALLGVAFLSALSINAFARGGGGGGMGGGGGFGGMGGFGSGGFTHGSPVGPSSSGAAANSNGRFSQDRDTGLQRAEDRMSQQGLDHEKATDQVQGQGQSDSDNSASDPTDKASGVPQK